jgi:hypothetical protein
VSLLDSVKQLVPEFKHIERTVVDQNGKTVGWHIHAFSAAGKCIAGGTAQNEENALRKCIAEMIERALIGKINSTPTKLWVRLDTHPTSCGFACGFDREKSRLRSLAEALERWHWSKWIDENFEISTASVTPNGLSPISQVLSADFDSLQFYSRNFIFQNMRLKFGAVIGVKGPGVFAGSRVCSESEDLWEHAIVESWRGLQNHITSDRTRFAELRNNVAFLRTEFFAKNGDCALEQIKGATKSEWPTPKILLQKEINAELPGVFLWRSLAEDYLPWDQGPVARFVY